jgi:hypothetical protein
LIWSEPAYHIKYAESADGIYWDRKGIVAIDYIDGKPSGISRPSVVKEVDGTLLCGIPFGVYDFRGVMPLNLTELATQRLLMV